MTTDDENLSDGEAPASATPDADLVLRTRSGDHDAFGELWRRHYRSGIVAARSITSSLDADDLVQESYAKIFQSIQRGNGPTGSFRAYLFTTIRNVAASWGRARTEATSDGLEEVEDPESTEVATDEALDRSLTHTAFRSLPTRWQEVLWYTEIEQMKPAEIAPLLGMKAAAVSQLAFRAREGLREAWIQAHIASVEDGSAHAWTIERLGAYTRGNLGSRDQAKVDAHLGECARCAIVASEAKEVGSRLALVLLPLTIGVTGTAGYLASLQRDESALVALAAMPSSVYEGAVAVAGGAVGAGAATGAAAGGAAKSGGFAAAGGGSGGSGGSAGGSASSAAWTIGGLVGAGIAAAAVAGTVLAATLTGGFAGSANEAASAFEDAAQPDASIEASDELLAQTPAPEEPIAPPVDEPAPSASPTPTPTLTPTPAPEPSAEPQPTAEPQPSAEPQPTAEPTLEPQPTAEPEPSEAPSPEPSPSEEPEPSPSEEPAPSPSEEPSPEPTPQPSEPAPEVESPAPIGFERASVVDARERIVQVDVTGEPGEPVAVTESSSAPAAASAMLLLTAADADALAEGEFSADGVAELQFALTAVQVTDDVTLEIAYRDVEGESFVASLSTLGVRDPLLEAVEPEPTPTPTVTPTASPTPTPDPTPTETPVPPKRIDIGAAVDVDKNAGTVEFAVTGEPGEQASVYVGGSTSSDDSRTLNAEGKATLTIALGPGKVRDDLPIEVRYRDGALAGLEDRTTLGELIDIEDVAINDALQLSALGDDVDSTATLVVSGEPDARVEVFLAERRLGTTQLAGGTSTIVLPLTQEDVRSDVAVVARYAAAHAVAPPVENTVRELNLSGLLDTSLQVGTPNVDPERERFTVVLPLVGEPGESVVVDVYGTQTVVPLANPGGNAVFAFEPQLSEDGLALSDPMARVTLSYARQEVWGNGASETLASLGVEELVAPPTPLTIESATSGLPTDPFDADALLPVTTTVEITGRPYSATRLIYSGDAVWRGVLDGYGMATASFTKPAGELLLDVVAQQDTIESEYEDTAHGDASQPVRLSSFISTLTIPLL
ncbi:sigma-70 family RNA polymerase sigma factor [Microbacterium barkeri]|uniref:sigma-70 family RNA polymerase sigma factor n=1 Tax=Microbacterium barkeri TaxID=33917 RepID=UPI0024AFA455|nr:sigma-70 family RNA polymerase sigma factor [Microbacterium barkeri]MDI6943905.1 sigma-70 family RNA polymerase sigma factor [Microbacterium barkeri]